VVTREPSISLFKEVATQVSRIVIHPRYDNLKNTDNIAILKLAKPLVLNKFASSVSTSFDISNLTTGTI
jgi:hypothetical protein